MRLIRLFWFFVSIVVGIVAGLYLAWAVLPAPYENASLHSLRSDYRADYVLMVAETFQSDGNLVDAIQRLEQYGGEPPKNLVQTAISTARDLGYSAHDLEIMLQLSTAIQKVGGGDG